MIKRLLIILIWLIAVPCYGATYYLDSAATEAGCAGISADPCKELDHIEDDAWSSGDKVLLKCGGTWSKSAGDWGSVTDQATIENDTNLTVGAYYLDGATPREVDGSTYKCSDVPAANPIIDGDVDTASCADVTYWGAIKILGGSTGITLQDIKFTRSYNGIYVRQEAGNSSAISDITIQRVQVDDVCLTGISVTPNPASDDDVSNITISDSTVTNTHIKFSGGASGWGCAIKCGAADSCTFTRNIVGQTYGEGICFHTEADDGVASYNLVYNTDSAGIYISSSDNVVVKNNYVIHGDSDWDNGGGRVNAGLGFGSEGDTTSDITDNSNCYFIGNVVIGYGSGFRATDGQDDADTSTGMNYVVNNTFIDNDYNYSLSPGADVEYEVTFQNNLSVVNDTSNSSHALPTAAPPAGYTFSGNGWDTSEAVDTDYCTATNCNDGTDVTGDPDLVDPIACDANGWRGCSPYTEPDWGDAALGASSAFKDNATDLGTGSSYLLLNANSEWPDSVNTLNPDTYGWSFGSYAYGATPVPLYPIQGAAGNFKYN